MVRTKIQEIEQSTTNETIRNYINDVLNLSSTLLLAFLSKVDFVSTNSDLFEEIRSEIRNKMIAEEYVDDVLYALYNLVEVFDGVLNALIPPPKNDTN